MLTIDGSTGEGGGQILRTALGLSLVTGTPFRIVQVRAKRKRPGLLAQHAVAVRAAAEIGGAEVSGASIGSRELSFRPTRVTPGHYAFAVETAGSATLVLQTVLPALILASRPTSLRVEGGTHNPWAPPFDFLQRAFLPVLNRMGPKVTVDLDRRGFYPAGGGQMTVSIDPAPELRRLDLTERGEIRAMHARAIVASLPIGIARREIAVVQRALSVSPASFETEEDRRSQGPGNVLTIEIESDHVTEVFTGFGQKGVRAEMVAKRAVSEARDYVDAGVAVGPHLADQLLLPLALAGAGALSTLPLTGHSTTNIEVIGMFLGRRFQVACVSNRRHVIRV